MATKKQKQVNVRFDGPTLNQIEELERLTGKSVSEILRESVNVSNWLAKERNNGAKILIERPGETLLREVIFKS